ncbi:helix-turn-helix domain-containing protein [Nocardia beijingensis]|uniref:helix-turn-helix domain-containing protein n=1 Tax=Nocardia beijingensis TaxID=95162 RepID=UPI001E475FBA|nr:helix-turn-helix transcriptional regulator [Nocardia beijingensis]
MPRRQLGRHLRDLRNRAGMTTRVAAQQLEWSEAKIWRIETGQTSLRGLDVEAMCKVYGAPPDLLERLRALARDTKAKGWWTAYGDVIPEGFDVYIGLEEAACRLLTYENELVPGLLQTEGYTRAVCAAAHPELSADEIDRRVRLRQARQALVTRPNAPLELDALIDEAVLCRRIGDPEVAAGQLDHLLRMIELPNVRIRLVPGDCGYHDGMTSGRFVLLEFPDVRYGEPPEPPVVYLEAFTGPVYVDKEPEIARFRTAFASIEAAAVDPRVRIEEVRKSL